MSLKIIVDSACDAGRECIRENDLTIVPLHTFFGEEEFLDGVTMSHLEFFERLSVDPNHPKTSQPSPYEFLTAIQKARETADEVLIITISGKLSGTNQSAVIAAEESGLQGIYVVDSENASIGTLNLVRLACRLRAQGIPTEKIVETLNREKKYIRVLAVLDTLKYLQKGGRISLTAAVAATMLNIKPIIAVENGELVVVGKARGAKSSERLLTQLVDKYGGIDYDMPFNLGYTGTSRDMLDEYINAYTDLWQEQVDSLPISTIGSTIGTHTGPGVIGLSFFAKNRG